MAEQILLVKTAAEITLKSFYVEKQFVRRLSENIKAIAKKHKIAVKHISKKRGRLLVNASSLKKLQKLLSKVFGIHSTAIAVHCTQKNSLNEMVLTEAKKVLKKGNCFAVRVKRSFEGKPRRQDIERELGTKINENIKGLKVNLSNPDKTVFVELNKNDFLVYSGEIQGAKGLPLGVSGKIAAIFEGKKEDAIAALLLMKRGCNVFPVIKSKPKESLKLIKKLEKWNLERKLFPAKLNELKELVKTKGIQGLVSSSHAGFALLQEFGLVQLFPLQFYPKNLLKEKQKMLGV